MYVGRRRTLRSWRTAITRLSATVSPRVSRARSGRVAVAVVMRPPGRVRRRVGCPVRVRKTSSRLGSWSSTASVGTRRASRRRTASADADGSATATRNVAASGSKRGSSPAARSASAEVAASTSAASARRTLSTLPPIWALSAAAVPWAAMRPRSTTAIRCARRSASSRYCVVSRTVVPSRRSSSTTAQSSWRERGSSPVVGSSSRITGGPPISPAARSSRRRMPPE